MSSVDVGDAVDLTYHGTTGSTVVVDWLNPTLVPTFEGQAVVEAPTGSGLFPAVLTPTSAGTWTALFRESVADTQSERFYVRASSPTGPAPLAVLADVQELYGTMTAAQVQLTNALLRAASVLVRSRYPSADAQIVAGLIDPDVAALAVTNMVLRVLRNPDGLRSETIGPFSRTYDTGAAAGLIVISDDEEPVFAPPAAAATFSLGTIRVAAGFPGSGWSGCG